MPKYILAFFLAAPTLLVASSASAITVSPVIVEHEIAPGEVASDVISIKNTSGRSERYIVTAQNFIAEGEEGRQTFLDPEAAFGLATWIATDVSNVTLAPNEIREIRYQIQVPSDATPGGHYAAVFFSTAPPQDSSVNVGVQGKVGVLFLVRVTGTVIEDAHVESFVLAQDSLRNRLPVVFETRIRNGGNVHLEPEGVIQIRNMFGVVTREVALNPKASVVLPDSVRRLESVWRRSGSLESDGGFFRELEREWRQFAFGHYTAEIDAVAGKSRVPLYATTTFWVLPWRLLLVGAAVAVLLIILTRGYARMTIRAALRKRRTAKKK